MDLCLLFYEVCYVSCFDVVAVVNVVVVVVCQAG